MLFFSSLFFSQLCWNLHLIKHMRQVWQYTHVTNTAINIERIHHPRMHFVPLCSKSPTPTNLWPKQPLIWFLSCKIVLHVLNLHINEIVVYACVWHLLLTICFRDLCMLLHVFWYITFLFLSSSSLYKYTTIFFYPFVDGHRLFADLGRRKISELP